ncbi:MerR family transcriptional regulator [Novosphingobium tardum]|uniref:MerR family transcriptional regulator n=1 Tax=Novosphingobium tardum TaxID=1538021 RepID=A0ABV8RPV4_9SPHN
MTTQVPLDFADGKDPQAFRTIGEVAQAFGLRQHVLRYWEEQFPMLRPLKRAGGRRYYRPEDVHLVAEISRLLYKEGFTIRGARQALGGKKPSAATAGDGAAPAVPVASAASPEPAPASDKAPDSAAVSLAKLRDLRDGLAQALGEG